MYEYRFKVSTLLQEPTGATRHHELDDERLDLGDGLVVKPVKGQVDLTRTAKGVLADVDPYGSVNLECARCLTAFEQPLHFPFSEEYYQTVVVTTGAPLERPDDPDVFLIDELHMLDLELAMREYALLNLPMLPLCKEDCKGLCAQCGANLNEEPCGHQDEVVDERFEALKQLLDRS